ncbi:hypothetical protein F5Y16DRAFT_399035 [Xylariaceae sp. FL0255]|nr:hypothetical protein F5Y16DRAFT_399035 [Xylariaceae sp. FL0255]
MSFKAVSITYVALLVYAWSIFVKAGGTITSWTNGLDVPQVIMQDDDTGEIRYSVCNSNGAAVFPTDNSRILKIDNGTTPKLGSSIAGAVMWWVGDENLIYVSDWQCNETGYLVQDPPSGQHIWPLTSAVSVHPQSGLAVVYIGPTAGYRVYYQQQDLTISILNYNPNPVNNGWSLTGNVSQDPLKGLSLSTGLTDSDKITVVSPRDGGNIEVSEMQPDNSWVISTFPTPLQAVIEPGASGKPPMPPTDTSLAPLFKLNTSSNATESPLVAWDGKANIGFTYDADATRRVFYIGNDSMVHCQIQTDIWQICPDVHPEAWPVADDKNAQFGSTFDFANNKIWIQAYRSSLDTWEDPIALPTAVPAVPNHNSSGLPPGAKAGAGIGAVAAISLIALVVYIFLQRKKGKREKQQADASANSPMGDTQAAEPFPTPAPAYTTVDGKWASTLRADVKSTTPWPECSSYQQIPASPSTVEATDNAQIHEMSNVVEYHEMAADQIEVIQSK